MKCAHCGEPLMEGLTSCPVCGCRLYIPDPEYITPPRKPKRHFPALIPLLILTVMFCFGLALFFLFPSQPQESLLEPDHGKDTLPTAPQKSQSADGTLPLQTDCFEVRDNVLYFLPDRYTGGRVLTIPETIGGQAIYAIGEYAFYDCDILTTIVLPSTIQAIGPGAFAECSQLRGMFIPEGTGYIAQDAFANCVSMEAIYVPSAMERIDEGAFEGCAALIYVFYSGFYEEWIALYPEVITPFTYAICLDGDYPHAAILP